MILVNMSNHHPHPLNRSIEVHPVACNMLRMFQENQLGRLAGLAWPHGCYPRDTFASFFSSMFAKKNFIGTATVWRSIFFTCPVCMDMWSLTPERAQLLRVLNARYPIDVEFLKCYGSSGRSSPTSVVDLSDMPDPDDQKYAGKEPLGEAELDSFQRRFTREGRRNIPETSMPEPKRKFTEEDIKKQEAETLEALKVDRDDKSGLGARALGWVADKVTSIPHLTSVIQGLIHALFCAVVCALHARSQGRGVAMIAIAFVTAFVGAIITKHFQIVPTLTKYIRPLLSYLDKWPLLRTVAWMTRYFLDYVDFLASNGCFVMFLGSIGKVAKAFELAEQYQIDKVMAAASSGVGGFLLTSGMALLSNALLKALGPAFAQVATLFNLHNLGMMMEAYAEQDYEKTKDLGISIVTACIQAFCPKETPSTCKTLQTIIAFKGARRAIMSLMQFYNDNSCIRVPGVSGECTRELNGTTTTGLVPFFAAGYKHGLIGLLAQINALGCVKLEWLETKVRTIDPAGMVGQLGETAGRALDAANRFVTGDAESNPIIEEKENKRTKDNSDLLGIIHAAAQEKTRDGKETTKPLAGLKNITEEKLQKAAGKSTWWRKSDGKLNDDEIRALLKQHIGEKALQRLEAQQKESELVDRDDALRHIALADKDGDGVVTKKEYDAYVDKLGGSKDLGDNLKKLPEFDTLDKDNDGRINLEPTLFEQLRGQKVYTDKEMVDEARINSVVKKLADSTGKNAVTKEQILEHIEYDPSISKEDIDAYMQEHDTNGDGSINASTRVEHGKIAKWLRNTTENLSGYVGAKLPRQAAEMADMGIQIARDALPPVAPFDLDAEADSKLKVSDPYTDEIVPIDKYLKSIIGKDHKVTRAEDYILKEIRRDDGISEHQPLTKEQVARMMSIEHPESAIGLQYDTDRERPDVDVNAETATNARIKASVTAGRIAQADALDSPVNDSTPAPPTAEELVSKATASLSSARDAIAQKLGLSKSTAAESYELLTDARIGAKQERPKDENLDAEPEPESDTDMNKEQLTHILQAMKEDDATKLSNKLGSWGDRFNGKFTSDAKQVIRMALSDADSNKNGNVTIKELQKSLGKDAADQIMKILDQNDDGEISLGSDSSRTLESSEARDVLRQLEKGSFEGRQQMKATEAKVKAEKDRVEKEQARVDAELKAAKDRVKRASEIDTQLEAERKKLATIEDTLKKVEADPKSQDKGWWDWAVGIYRTEQEKQIYDELRKHYLEQSKAELRNGDARLDEGRHVKHFDGYLSRLYSSPADRENGSWAYDLERRGELNDLIRKAAGDDDILTRKELESNKKIQDWVKRKATTDLWDRRDTLQEHDEKQYAQRKSIRDLELEKAKLTGASTVGINANFEKDKAAMKTRDANTHRAKWLIRNTPGLGLLDLSPAERRARG